MDSGSIAIISAGVLAFSAVMARLEETVVTPPMVFVLFGVLTGALGLNLVHIDVSHGAVHAIATLTLVLVLFADAGRISPEGLLRRHALPQRLLLIGLPLTVLSGAAVAWAFWPELPVWEVALLGAILAPTDPALSQSVVTDRAVPGRIRQALNVESGLNDGIALPIVLLFAALAGPSETNAPTFFQLAPAGIQQLVLGPIVGIAVGLVGARLAGFAISAANGSSVAEGMAVLAVAVLAFAAAGVVGGNGFLSAFAAGLTFGSAIRRQFMFQFMDTEGQLLTLLTFLVIGTTLLPEAWARIDMKVIAYGVLSLTVVRLIPVALSLAGAGMRWQTCLFIGWFGPRELASILFVLLIFEQYDFAHGDLILSVVVVTVLLSVFLHGLTAAPLTKLYGRLVAGFGPCEESAEVAEIPTRYERVQERRR